MDLLRQRASASDSAEKKGKRRKDENDMKLIASSSSMQVAALPTTNGHINLFEDLEHVCPKSISGLHGPYGIIPVIDSESDSCRYTGDKKDLYRGDGQGYCPGSSAQRSPTLVLGT